jgi:hypothetical protein
MSYRMNGALHMQSPLLNGHEQRNRGQRLGRQLPENQIHLQRLL